jgi:hypothetical protein
MPGLATHSVFCTERFWTDEMNQHALMISFIAMPEGFQKNRTQHLL